MTKKYRLVSHALCPYVQRAAIVLLEKNLAFEKQDVDLANKPEWFITLSPLGKTPVLVVDGTPLFESAAICDFLDETIAPPLHPRDALERAQHRAWIAFGSALLNAIGAFYAAPDEATLTAKTADIRRRFAQLEAVLGAGPYFNGETFSIVDAAYAPALRYFEVFETISDFGFFTNLPKLLAWRTQLAQRRSVQAAVKSSYPQLLRRFLLDRSSALSQRMAVL